MFVNERHPKGGGVIYKVNNLDLLVTNKSYICILIPTGFLELFNQQKSIGGQLRNSGKTLLGSLAALRGRTRSRFSCLLPEGGSSWFLQWGEGRGRLVVGWRGGLGDRPALWEVPCAGITCRTLVLLPAPQKRQLLFGLFVSYCS